MTNSPPGHGNRCQGGCGKLLTRGTHHINSGYCHDCYPEAYKDSVSHYWYEGWFICKQKDYAFGDDVASNPEDVTCKKCLKVMKEKGIDKGLTSGKK